MSAVTAPIRPLSEELQQLVLEAFSPTELRHFAAAAEARGHLSDWLARELSEELAVIFSSPPLEIDGRLVHNLPSVGWWKRRAERIAEARAS